VAKWYALSCWCCHHLGNGKDIWINAPVPTIGKGHHNNNISIIGSFSHSVDYFPFSFSKTIILVLQLAAHTWPLLMTCIIFVPHAACLLSCCLHTTCVLCRPFQHISFTLVPRNRRHRTQTCSHWHMSRGRGVAVLAEAARWSSHLGKLRQRTVDATHMGHSVPCTRSHTDK